jgi:DNA-binding NarL/FixJ family response regulator
VSTGPVPPAPPIRIVVVDDQEVVRSAFGAMLDTQPDFAVVGLAADGAAAVELCRERDPDVVIMDVRMPRLDGIAATRRIVAASADDRPRIVMLTTFDLDEHVYDALDAGASGFLLKDVTAEQLFDAVRVVAAGDGLIAPTVTRRLIAEFARRRPSPAAGAPGVPEVSPASAAIERLTGRETEVLRLIAEGLSNAEIATRLTIGEQTVKTHVSRVLTKLGLRDRTQAVAAAYETGLVVAGTRDLRGR